MQVGLSMNRIVFAVIITVVLSGTSWGKYSGGSGTEDDPYQIGTTNDWINLKYSSEDWNKYIILIADIDFNGNEIQPIAPDTDKRDEEWQGVEFNGVLDGQGHVIQNFVIYEFGGTQSFRGLIGSVGLSGKIRNLGLVNCKIMAGDRYVGSLCGRNSGMISHCYSKECNVIGTSEKGGLCGINYGSITHCYTAGAKEIWGGRYVGGLCGWNNGLIDQSFSSLSFFDGDIVGGLCGSNRSVITYCYATGKVGGRFRLGGLCGDSIGGTINQCYSTGLVTYTGSSLGVGGFCGYKLSDSIIKDCLWDRETSGQAFSFGGKGLTTAQMQSRVFYGINGWAGEIWTLAENSYPRLSWEMAGGELISEPEVTMSGNGSAEEPWQITCEADLIQVGMGSFYWDKHLQLTADLDLSGLIMPQIGYDAYNAFRGNFNGGGHTISNLELSMPYSSNVGLFGFIGVEGRVMELGLKSSTISGYDIVGGLCGYNEGSIEQCYASGEITAFSDYAGGICGWSTGSISQCYTTGIVRSAGLAGGLCRINSGTVNQCYSACLIMGDEERMASQLSDSGTYKDCIWDIDVSGQAECFWGIGLTTAQMQSMDYYSANGWSSTIWTKPLNSYPRLAWEMAGGEPISEPIVTMSGDGSMENPWQIACEDDLVQISMGSCFWDKNYQLVADLDLTGIEMRRIGYDGVNAFTGQFHGDGHTISNLLLLMPASNYVGLFGFIGNGGQVENLGVVDTIVSGRAYVGGLCGYNNGGEISHSSSSGFITDSDRAAGGLCGMNSGKIKQSYATSVLMGNYGYVGGLCGMNTGTDASITQCYATSALMNNIGLIGGLCGYNYENCIINQSYVSSILLNNEGGSLGGLCGVNSAKVNQCYSTSVVSQHGERVGGLCGTNEGECKDSLWDIEVSGQSGSYGGLGLTTDQMQSVAYYSANGWGGADWLLPENSYPHLAWEMTGGEMIREPEVALSGSGSLEDPWQINSVDELLQISMGSYYWDQHYQLMRDLDLSNVSMYRIGYDDINAFAGSFNGGGHILSNLSMVMPSSDYVGVFGCIGTTGHVKGLCVETSIISGRYFVGGLVGYNYGSVQMCSVSGEVVGDGYYIGGLSGRNIGMVVQSFASGSVTGNGGYVGGLCGYNGDYGIIKQCYATSDASANGSNLGGLCSVNRGVIEQCYATGALVNAINSIGGLCDTCWGEINSSFWDVETTKTGSPGDTDKGAIGKRTSEMQTIDTFLKAGWDFSGELLNGVTDIWHMPYQATGYPMLWWQRDIPGDTAGRYGVDMEDYAAVSAEWLDEFGMDDLMEVAGYWLER